MREAADGVESEGTRATLDRMRGAKQRVDQLALIASLLEAQQRMLHRLDGFEALLVEGVPKLREIDRHRLMRRLPGSTRPTAVRGVIYSADADARHAQPAASRRRSQIDVRPMPTNVATRRADRAPWKSTSALQPAR